MEAGELEPLAVWSSMGAGGYWERCPQESGFFSLDTEPGGVGEGKEGEIVCKQRGNYMLLKCYTCPLPLPVLYDK